MNKKKKKIIRYSVIIGVIVVALAVLLIAYANRSAEATQYHVQNVDEMDFNPYITTEERYDNSVLEYGKVLTKYAKRGYTSYTGDDIPVGIDSITGSDGNDGSGSLMLLNDVDGYRDGFKYTADGGDSEKVISTEENKDALYVSGTTTTMSFSVTTDTAGLYSLYLEYLMLPGRDADMLVNFTVDGKLPFLEASNMALKRMYSFYDYDYESNKDVIGNQIRPKSQETYGWQSTVMSNPDGKYRNPYRFYLQKGTHQITLTFTREAGAIRNIRFIAPVVNPTYDEYKAANGYSDSAVYHGNAVRKELEVPDYTTSINIRMESDNNYYTSSDSGMDPYRVSLFNVFGGDQWCTSGDKVQWSFYVEESGWYELGFRYKSQTTYVSSFKEVAIDGKIPFAEMEEYCFPYADGWTAISLLDENQNPYLFYLEGGQNHTISLVNKVGPLRHTLQRIEESMDSISVLVNNIVKITASARTSTGGYTIDTNRDYDLQLYIPTLPEDIKTYAEVFRNCYSEIVNLNGGKVTSYASAVKVAQDLFEDLDENIEDVAISLNDINNAQTGLSNTMVSIRQQPICVDYMVLAPQGYDYPNSRSNAWQGFYVSMVRFFSSFNNKKYENAGAREELNTDGMPEIEVYVARGREHVDMMRNLVSEQFTPEYGIKVNINMVAGSSEGLIMPRYVAKTAPDLAISITPGNVFEFGIRGALLNLDQFETTTYNGAQVIGFKDLWESSFYDAEFVPYLYKGHYYGFPETQSWSALFYRTDIFETLGLNPPDTWDDVYNILPTLTNNGYNFCYNYAVGGYTPFLYQHGGDFYDANAMVSGLNTESAYDGFMEFADLYLQYNFIYAANFYMRFKSGEMPIGIGDLAFYQQLNYSAPELNGKWAMVPVPGHKRIIDGQEVIDRSTSGLGTCCIIINKNNQPESSRHYLESWAFLQWWLSDSVQSEYGREVEATFGVASRWNPANKNAAQTLPYTQEELDVINAQWEWLKESPNTLGGYYTSRYLLTALNQTVIQGLSGRIALEDAVKEINKEMRRKQDEFGIPKDGSILYETAVSAD